MGWNFEDVGEFSSDHEAREWARRNNIDPRDFDVRRNGGGGVSASVRRSALDPTSEQDRSFGRRDGFY